MCRSYDMTTNHKWVRLGGVRSGRDTHTISRTVPYLAILYLPYVQMYLIDFVVHANTHFIHIEKKKVRL